MINQPLKSNGYKWLKALHVLFSTLWLGSAVALVGGQLWLRSKHEIPPYFILETLNFIDWFILVPGATGVTITGVLFSLKTNWGWGKEFFWIRAKWIIALLGVVVGTFFLAPWLDTLIKQAKNLGTGVYKQEDYLTLSNWLLFWGIVQMITLVYAVYLSIFKPKTFRKPIF